MGNCLYSILTNKDVFEDFHSTQVKEMVIKGKRPFIDADFESTDPVDQVLRLVIEATMKQAPVDRISARAAQKILEGKLKELDPDWKLTDPYNA